MHADQTIFTVMRDPQALRMYYKSFEDQTIRMVDLNRFDLDAKEVMRLPTATDTQPVVATCRASSWPRRLRQTRTSPTSL